MPCVHVQLYMIFFLGQCHYGHCDSLMVFLHWKLWKICKLLGSLRTKGFKRCKLKVSMIHRWSKSIMNQARLNQQPLAPTSQHWRLIPLSMGKKTWTKLATLGHVSTEEATWREVYEKKEPSLNTWSCSLFWIFLRATISAARNHQITVAFWR